MSLGLPALRNVSVLSAPNSQPHPRFSLRGVRAQGLDRGLQNEARSFEQRLNAVVNCNGLLYDNTRILPTSIPESWVTP
jgi:hypothetical protein